MRRNSTISNSHDVATDPRTLQGYYNRISIFKGFKAGGQVAAGLGGLGMAGSILTFTAQNIATKSIYGDFSSMPYLAASTAEAVAGLVIVGLANKHSHRPRFTSRADPLYQTNEARHGAGVMFSLLASTAVAAAVGFGVNHVMPPPEREPAPIDYSVGQIRAPKLPTLVARPA